MSTETENKGSAANTKTPPGKSGTKTQPSASQGTDETAHSNPYVSRFIRSMSQEEEGGGAVAKSGSKRQPSTGIRDSPISQGSDGSAAKKPRVYTTAWSGGGGATTRTRGYRRAVRPEPPRVERVRREMEQMDISSSENNPYVDRFVRGLSEHQLHEPPALQGMSSSCPKLNEDRPNPYVAGYHQRLVKRHHRACQTSQPNFYVAQLHRTLVYTCSWKLSRGSKMGIILSKLFPPLHFCDTQFL